MSKQDFKLIKMKAIDAYENINQIFQMERKVDSVRFILEINSDRLTADGFRKGDQVFIKPVIHLIHGKIICLKAEQVDFIFRRVNKINGSIFLDPVNQNGADTGKPEPMRESDKERIIGQVVLIARDAEPMGVSFTDVT
ncbi:S24 family peptidase [uncultured Dialister sp.]|uniref:S24 family peptidase n=1 Tax=uncultured Dialister sp. TaxID=278064 RepID=UPI0025E6A106|nr:S24 family peptidase [uncultured Dialister sp.]